MRLGRFEIGTWDQKDKNIIWFEYFSSSCKCKFLTICNILFIWYDRDCLKGENEYEQ